MPTQQRITQYLVPNSNDDNLSGDVGPRQNEDGVVLTEMEKMCEQMVSEFKKSTEAVVAQMKIMMENNAGKVIEIRSEMNERLIRAEKTIVETMEEVLRLRSEILELKNQRQSQPEEGEDVEVGREQGDRQQELPHGVSSEVLLSMIQNHQRAEDEYWRSSLMITIGSGEFGNYTSWVHKLRTCGLHFLLESVRSHYVTGRGNLRLTFATEFEMRKTLIRGRKYCKEKRITNIHIEFLVPKRYVSVKKKFMRYGRQLKINQNVTSYDVIMRGGEPVLRTFHHSVGVRYWTLQELEEHQHTRQYGIGDTIIEMVEDENRPRQDSTGDATNAEDNNDDGVILTDEDGIMYIEVNPLFQDPGSSRVSN